VIPGATQGTLVRVGGQTFRNPWLSERESRDAPVVACFRRGKSATLFIEDHSDMSKKKPAAKQLANPEKPARLNFAEDGEGGDDKKPPFGEKGEDSSEDGGEEMEDGGDEMQP